MTGLILTIDQGTTGTTAAYFDLQTLAYLCSTKIEFPQIYPKPGYVEHDPEDIWQSTLAAIEQATEILCKTHRGRNPSQIRALAITNQRETVVPWNKRTGEIAGNALVWQDRRTAAVCDELKNTPQHKNYIHQETGLIPDPYFSATKMQWILENNPTAKKWAQNEELILGTIDSWILYKLTGGTSIATEHTNASRTMLYSLHTGTYNSHLLKLFGIPFHCLPPIHPSIHLFGYTQNVKNLPDGIPICGILGDQQAALYGHNCINSGESKITYGTGAFLLMNTGTQPIFSTDGLLTTVALSTQHTRTFALEGAAFIAGAAIQFLRDNLGWIKNSSESRELALSAPRDPSVMFIPSLAGLAAPYWNPKAKGVLLGLTRGTQKAQIIRAVLESIALQNVALLELMEKTSNIRIAKVGVDGGASKNDFLLQFQSDMLGISLTRPGNIEVTAKGGARAARSFIAPNLTEDSDEHSLTFSPLMPKNEAQKIYEKWSHAVELVNQFYASNE